MTKTDNVYTAINAVMQQIGYVQKAGKNKHFGYKFAGEADFIKALRPLMVEQGLVIVPLGAEGPPTFVQTTSKAGNLVYQSYCFKMVHAPSGTETDPCMITACGQDPGDKGPYKLMTGALKYFLRHVFLMETGDDPEDSSGPNPHEDAPRAATPPPADTQPTGGENPGERAVLVEAFKEQNKRIGKELTRDAFMRVWKVVPKSGDLPDFFQNAEIKILRELVKAMTDSQPAPGGTK